MKLSKVINIHYFNLAHSRFTTEVTLIKGSQYELLLADTAGQDEYSMFPAEYSADVDGYVLVYSIGNVMYNAYQMSQKILKEFRSGKCLHT